MQELTLGIKDKKIKVIFFSNVFVIFVNNLRRRGKVEDEKKWS